MKQDYVLCYNETFVEFFIFAESNHHLLLSESQIPGYTLIIDQLFDFNIQIDPELPNHIQTNQISLIVPESFEFDISITEPQHCEILTNCDLLAGLSKLLLVALQRNTNDTITYYNKMNELEQQIDRLQDQILKLQSTIESLTVLHTTLSVPINV